MRRLKNKKNWLSYCTQTFGWQFQTFRLSTNCFSREFIKVCPPLKSRNTSVTLLSFELLLQLSSKFAIFLSYSVFYSLAGSPRSLLQLLLPISRKISITRKTSSPQFHTISTLFYIFSKHAKIQILLNQLKIILDQ